MKRSPKNEDNQNKCNKKSLEGESDFKISEHVKYSIITCISQQLETPLLCTAADKYSSVGSLDLVSEWHTNAFIKFKLPEFQIAGFAQISRKELIVAWAPGLKNPYL